MSTFEISGDDFVLDGHPHQVIAGALHYFRVPREYWADRIRKARQMGLDTIETYVAWNLHAPTPDSWDVSGNLDLGAFLDAVAAQGMHAIVRPGPYICSEFDNGGLPHWLTDAGRTPLRCSDPRFLAPTLDYLRRVYEIVAPRQIHEGGPVIIVQVENEYGAWGRDLDYLRTLTRATRDAGITVPLTTVDQPRPSDLPHGTLPELLTTGSFGSRVDERLRALREVQPTGPLMCSEFWCGWFDSALEYHHTTPAEVSAAALDELLTAGASVNIYMFHGGTNFGLTNGANDKGLYRPLATSYDYDAPLDEAGNPTEKYWAFRDVIARHRTLGDDVPPIAGPAPTPSVVMTGASSLPDVIERLNAGAPRVVRGTPPTFDELGLTGGYMLYEADVDTVGPSALRVGAVKDRAIVFADGVRVGTLERVLGDDTLALPGATHHLGVLVEDMGRVDYGPCLGEAKGLIGPVTLDGVELEGWQVTVLDPHDPTLLSLAADTRTPGDPTSHTQVEASFVHATVGLERTADLFLDLSHWGRGLTWVNGRLLGRHWHAGPTRTLYVPAPWLHPGSNDIVVFDTEALVDVRPVFVDAPDLGPLDW